MIKKITYVVYIIFFFINHFFNKITKKDFLTYFKEFIESDSYTKIKILNKNKCYRCRYQKYRHC